MIPASFDLKRSYTGLLTLGILILVFLLFFIYAKSHSKLEPQIAPLLHEKGRLIIPEQSPLRQYILIEKVVEQQVITPYTLPATVEADPATLINVLPPLLGRITSLNKRLGDSVKAGDILFTLDSADLAQALSDLEKAKSNLTLTEENLKRQQSLTKSNIAARRDLQQASNDYFQAVSELQRAKSRLTALNVDPSSLKEQLLVIRSPISGFVVDLQGAVGGYWNDPNAAIMTVADLSRVYVTASSQEKDLGQFYVGQEVDVVLNAYSLHLPSKVQSIGALLNPDTRTVSIRMIFDNQSGKLKPNMFGSANFLSKPHQGIVLPLTTVIQRGFNSVVFVEVAPWQFEPRILKLGTELNDKVEVLSGLKADERIVVREGLFSMIEQLVTQCFHRRGIVVLVFLFVSFYGFYCWKQLPLEAYPDIAPTTSQVITQVNGLAAEEVEQQITIPLEREIMGTPGVSVMRSRSTFGLSLITVVFQDGSEDYWSRQRLLERINGVTLPYDAQAGLDALTSPIGEIFRYTVDSETRTLRELSELQFWKIIPRLKQVPGVTDVANFGGITTQFLLELKPENLFKYKISLAQIIQTINTNNANAGGSLMNRGEQGIVVRGLGLIRNLRDYGNIEVTQSNSVPVFLKDIGQIKFGNKQRHGIVGKDKNPDVVEGITLLLRNQNPSRVMDNVHAAVKELNEKILPKDVKIVPYLDRSDLVNATVRTVGETLFDGMTMVILVLLFFLGSMRAAAIVAITIPISLLIAFTLMYHFKIPANLLSLGAIDFGIIVDGAIVVMENILRHREENADTIFSEKEVLKSTLQVTQPIFFGILVIITAYSVLFAFQQIEYKLFSPMAFAIGFALIGALLVALTLIPGLAYWSYHNPIKIYKNRLITWLMPRYEALLRRLIGQTKLVLGLFAATLVLVILLGATIGRDFLPYLDEGSLWLQVTLPPGISLNKASEIAGQIRSATLEFKEVSHIISQLGRNDDGTDPFTPSHIECAITLHPYKTWKSGWTKQELIKHLSARYTQIAGVHVGFTQPMIDGVLDKVAGAHSDLVVKVYGQDFQGLRKLATSIVNLLKTIPGAQDVIIDQEPPMTELRIEVDRLAIARYGINIADVMTIIQTGIGGDPVNKIYIGESSYDVTAKFTKPTRNNPKAISNLLLTAANGAQIALAQLAKINFVEGQTTITREMNKRQLLVRLNLRERDLVSFTKEANKRLEHEIHYDHTLYEITWGGQLENQQRAQARLMVILPMLLGLMFVLLFSQFGNLRQPGLILLAVPLAMFGGLVSLHLRDMTLNVSSAVGFIALFGVAVLNAIIMIANLNRWQLQPEISSLKEAVVHGAKERLRPVLMTATVAAIGMIPAASAHGLGSDVQRPLATVIVGGLITATALTLILLPALYYLIEKHFIEKQAKKAQKMRGIE